MKFAPRISPRLLALIERLADRDLSPAEICRLVGDEAVRLGLTRPSYQRVRVLVRVARSRPRPVSTGEVLLDIALRAKPATAIMGPTPPPRQPKRR
jgi:hypothetical protein